MKFRHNSFMAGLFALAVPLLLGACGRKAASDTDTPLPQHVVEVTARDFTFEVVNEIPSGWITFHFKNEGNMIHFFLLTLLPEEVTFENYLQHVGGAFGAAWEALRTGETDKAGAGQILGENLPAWFADAKSMGGPGLIGGKQTSKTTMRLVPGNYVMECYIKTEDGKFHTELGMTRPLTVTHEVAPGSPPDADIHISVSNADLVIDGDISPGEHTVAVNFVEHPPYGLGNDVHLVRMNEPIDLNVISEWMDWMNISGLTPPAPAEFLGGAQEMPVGNTAYFTIELTPGRYAWVSESSPPKGLVRGFVVE